jgi:hypothetical protein
MKYVIPYTMPGQPPAFGTPLGAPLDRQGSRKRPRYPLRECDAYNNPPMYLTADPYRLAHSRRIIEIGAMAVRKHGKIDPALEDSDGMSAHERILRKLEDVEKYLRRDEGDNEDALKWCAMIRAALLEIRAKAQDGGKGGEVQKEDEDVPSKMMTVDGDVLFDSGLDDDGIMGLLMRENERLDGGKDAK